VRERLTVLAVSGIDDLDVGAGVASHEILAADLVDDDHVGFGEVLRSSDGQQTGVARTGADKGYAGRVTGSLPGPCLG
jgi:hypothetical protein